MKQTKTYQYLPIPTKLVENEIVEAMADRVVNCLVMDINGNMSKRIYRYYFEEDFKEAIRLAETQTKKELLEMIEKERDEGNVEGGGFSAALCLSKVIKWLNEGEEK